MSERISIKGKGASIFFDEEEDIAQHPAQPETQLVDDLARSDPGAEASRHHSAEAPMNASADKQMTEATRQPASDSTSRRPIESAGAPGPSTSSESDFFESLMAPLSLKRKLRVMSRDRHPHHTSVRISEDERDALVDICYQLGRKMGLKLTANDVIRIGVKLLLEDYALRKTEGLLGQVLKEENEY